VGTGVRRPPAGEVGTQVEERSEEESVKAELLAFPPLRQKKVARMESPVTH
jgi:hypothetical protein